MNIEKSRSKSGNHLTIEHRKSISQGLTEFKIPKACRLKRKYNLTQEEWIKLRDGQNNKCAICLTEFDSTPCVDHDHKTGVNRGLLCQKCNRWLGMINDDTSTLTRALVYLSKTSNI